VKKEEKEEEKKKKKEEGKGGGKQMEKEIEWCESATPHTNPAPSRGTQRSTGTHGDSTGDCGDSTGDCGDLYLCFYFRFSPDLNGTQRCTVHKSEKEPFLPGHMGILPWTAGILPGTAGSCTCVFISVFVSPDLNGAQRYTVHSSTEGKGSFLERL